MIKLKNLIDNKIIESFSKKSYNRKGKHPSKISNRKINNFIPYDDEAKDEEPENTSNKELSLYSNNLSRITQKFRYINDEDEAELIQSQYEKFAQKAGIEPANLIYHLLSKNGVVWTSYGDGKKLSANYFIGNFIGDIFTVSHFAPQNLRLGHVSLLELLHQSTPVIFAVPEKLAIQLEKIGYKKIFKKVPMKFRGSIMDKTILINKSFEKKDYSTMLAYWMQMAIKSGLIEEDPRVKEFFKRLTYVVNKKNIKQLNQI